MDEQEWLAQQFEENRGHLKAIAYRMLGSVNEADDAVQEVWLRLSRFGASGVANVGGWLTTVVARVCLDMLRSRKARREEPLEGHVPDPIVSCDTPSNPEREILLADSVGLALLVVLETLEPAERLAFVLHDMFSMSFDDVAGILDRSAAAARQLASRARRRVQGTAPASNADIRLQREIVNAFLAASRNGDFDALLAVLDPDVVLRADAGSLQPGASKVVRGAARVAEQALLFSGLARHCRLALVNGTPGLVTAPGGRPYAVIGFAIQHGKIVEIDILADPKRLRQLNPPVVLVVGHQKT
jgi:RNA polymerase sigma-70 factor (ECF subfamily)